MVGGRLCEWADGLGERLATFFGPRSLSQSLKDMERDFSSKYRKTWGNRWPLKVIRSCLSRSWAAVGRKARAQWSSTRSGGVSVCFFLCNKHGPQWHTAIRTHGSQVWSKLGAGWAAPLMSGGLPHRCEGCLAVGRDTSPGPG